MNTIKNILFFVFVLFLINNAQSLPENWVIGYAIDIAESNNIVVTFTQNYPNPSGVFLTTDNEAEWKDINTSDHIKSVVDVSMTDAQHIWLATANGKIITSADSGITWVVQFADSEKTVYMNYIEMFDNSNGIAMGDALNKNLPAVFLKTTDGGQNWQSVNPQAFGAVSGDTWRRLDFVDKDIGYFFESGNNPQKLYKTIDGGVNWKATNYPSSDLQVLKFYDADYGLAISGKNKIYRTIDGGENWKAFQTRHQGWGNDIEFDMQNPSRVWFTDGKGIYISNDSAKTWTKLDSDKDDLKARDIAFDKSEMAWVLGDNGNLYSWSYIPTSVDNIPEMPNTIHLSQNYPNPFNPTTTIEYTVETLHATSQHVELSIYDVLGREVKTLVSENQSAGKYRITFNATGLASGIYFYRLYVGNKFSSTKKLVLLE